MPTLWRNSVLLGRIIEMPSARTIAPKCRHYWTVATEAIDAQCPDGSPPPCGRPQSSAARPAPPSAHRARHLMFLPFRNVTRRPEHEWLVAGAPLMLEQALGQFRDLSVVPDERLTAARQRLRMHADSVPDAA
jgi:hypothetical protein